MDSHFIIEKAKELGFELAGVCSSVVPDQDKQNIQTFIENGFFGQMHWFPKNNQIRIAGEGLGFSPRSAIVLGILYNTPEYKELEKKFTFRFSRYAVGEDYHTVLKKKAKPLLDLLKEKYPENHFRQGVDSLPIPEKVLAREAGLGWIGKNTNLINSQYGSFFFLSAILTDLKLEYFSPVVDRCGSCRKCLEHCPTGALFEEYKIDAGKCISHHTIEDKRENLPVSQEKEVKDWIYGCDICQSVCPWNEKSEKWGRYSKVREFLPDPIFQKTSDSEFFTMEEEEFRKWSKRSAVARLKFRQFQRNIRNFLKNKG